MQPFISLILPIRNEASAIAKTLASVLAQDYPPDRMEILVVDGLSTDDTPAIVARLAADSPRIPIRLLENPGRIVPTGLNLALREARGEYILRVDGHTLLAPDYARRCVEAFESSGAQNVGGRMNAVGTALFSKAVAVATSTPFGIGGGRFHFSDREEWVDTVYMGAWPRSLFDRIGLFDEELVRDQDDEFNYRLREAGGRILLSPEIKSEYTVRGSPSSLWRQYFQYGFWKVRVLQKHPRQMSLRQFIPPLFVLALLVSLGLALFQFIRPGFAGLSGPALLLAACLAPALYLVANISASILTSVRKGWQYLPLLPVVFGILHLSYGSGFLLGLLKFRSRWGDRVGRVPVFSHEESAPS